jgi:uncharacterized protein (DUF1501 family)
MKRRNFINLAAKGIVIPSVLNGFNVKAYAGNSLFHSLYNPAVDTDHVLVLIYLAGGNDGLHTVVPVDQFANLANARQTIILPENQLLSLNGINNVKLHPAMTGMQQLFNEGKVKIIQSVGYPNQDYSHFRSTDIWMTGANSNQYLNTGWTGRYLHHEYPGYPNNYPNALMPDPLAVEIGYALSLNFQGPLTGMGMAISDPEEFYRLIDNPNDPPPPTNAGKQLAYVQLIADQSKQYGTVIKNAASRVTRQSPYPQNNFLADQLKIVARLIAGGLKTRLYMVNIGGFDTHDTQVDAANHSQGAHANLLKQVSDAVSAFMKDCEFLNIDNRVAGMTFSEFGRRIIGNGSNGTDHGESAPLFIFGKAVQGGVLGNNPVIPRNATVADNLPMQHDFRQVYATMFKDWFCLPANDVDSLLLKRFESLPVINTSYPCSKKPVDKDDILVNIYPNPFTDTVNIKFESKGGLVLIQIIDMAGRLIDTVVSRNYDAGIHLVSWKVPVLLPAGHYYCRMYNEDKKQAKAIVKIRN